MPAVRGSNGDMVSLNAQVLQTLLHVYPYRRTASPDTHNKVGAKAAVKNVSGQAEGLLQQLLFFNELFFHGGLSPEDIGAPQEALYSLRYENPKR